MNWFPFKYSQWHMHSCAQHRRAAFASTYARRLSVHSVFVCVFFSFFFQYYRIEVQNVCTVYAVGIFFFVLFVCFSVQLRHIGWIMDPNACVLCACTADFVEPFVQLVMVRNVKCEIWNEVAEVLASEKTILSTEHKRGYAPVADDNITRWFSPCRTNADNREKKNTDRCSTFTPYMLLCMCRANDLLRRTNNTVALQLCTIYQTD